MRLMRKGIKVLGTVCSMKVSENNSIYRCKYLHDETIPERRKRSESSKAQMDERNPFDEGRAAISKTPNSPLQRSCSLPIIWPRSISKQFFVDVSGDTRRKAI